MGLDNGIIAKNRKTKEQRKIAYWRKCYGLRGDIFSIIDAQETDGYYYPISTQNLLKILKQLYHYNSKTWSYSIWTWKEIKPSIRKQKRKILFWYIYSHINKNWDFLFYDSY